MENEKQTSGLEMLFSQGKDIGESHFLYIIKMKSRILLVMTNMLSFQK